MHVRFPGKTRGRRGMSFAMLANMFTVLLGFAGRCIDVGVVALSRDQLQTVADAAALAGARQLADPKRVSPTYSLTTAEGLARTRVIAIAKANTTLGQAGVVLDNPTNDPSGDVVLGYKDTTVKNSALVTAPSPSTMENSVQVNARRDATHGGLIPAFFSKALGFSDSSLAIKSTATAQLYSVQGFKTAPTGLRTTLIPIALNVTTWNAMIARQTTDNYTYNSPSTVSTGGDGIYESSLYPSGSGAGNFGKINIGAPNNGVPFIADQITNGVKTDDLAVSGLGSGGYLTVSPAVSMGGTPGISLGLKTALTSLIGKTVMVPLYDPVNSGGNGANFVYSIVGFAPVVVLNITFQGVNTQMIVQPSLITDPFAVLGQAQSSWSAGGIVRLQISQ
jgi:hypothetical protein